MAYIEERERNGIKYVYLRKSVKYKNNVHKISKFLGRKADITKKRLKKEIKKFNLIISDRIVTLRLKEIKKNFDIKYPIILEEIKKIEEMNFKYKEIKTSLKKEDWEDIKKRFIANFVFESNALEGNSLTLKNFSEIIFENKIINSADLREVYDAKNSYEVFSKLFSGRKDIDEQLILNLHKKIMKNIDTRIGYKKLPNILLGRRIELAKPENVPKQMKLLLSWYKKNSEKLYPLELAFKFHHKFEQIHPFSDGNGRVGRMLLNYILIKHGYYPIIIRKSQRIKYLKALEAADNKQYIPLMRFALEKTKETYRNFFEIYYKYLD
ncbi:Fic family protein [Nanoarchaeota archaeon]